MQHNSKAARRPLINPGTITITEDGFLASLPVTGPGAVRWAKTRALIFNEAQSLGWVVRIAKQNWGA